VIGEQFIIVGQSYAGLLTRGFVNRYPELISKIILLVPCIIPGVRQGRVEPLKAVERDEEFLATLTKEEYDNFTMMNVVLTREVWERYSKSVQPALDIADWDFLNNVLEGSFTFDPDDMAEPCMIPTLIITAKQDTEVGYKDQFDLMKIYPNSTYCAFERAGHNLQIEQPELFENTVRSWLLTH
jgi:pimeloyl-ACP methyl ester carboxylesterase